MRKLIRCFVILLFCAGLSFPSPATAGTGAVQVLLHAPFDPQTAFALIVTPAGTVRQEASKIEKRTNGDCVITAKIDENFIKPENYATAVVFGPAGEIAYGEMKRLSEKVPELNMVKSLPVCDVKEANNPIYASDPSALQQLIDVRKEKAKLLRDKIREALDEGFAKKVRGLEEVFGLQEATPLSADLPALELSNRLSRLLIAYHNLDYHKQFMVTPEPTAAGEATPEEGKGKE